MFHHWAADAMDNLELNVARIVFNGNGCFASCARENISKFKPQEKVDSKYEPFVVPGLPDRIEMTRSQLPVTRIVQDNMRKSKENCYGLVVNSFYELEPAYVEQFKKGNRAWIVGPVSLYNRNRAWIKPREAKRPPLMNKPSSAGFIPNHPIQFFISALEALPVLLHNKSSSWLMACKLRTSHLSG
ncbi:hypothetical protein V6N13_134501 [Hibiscus sabdariffa]|uniref:Uncharacterized protein n=1 Tax=Hibiscus sabdariffa TaxID=183260 RepID=A0ABR2R403_9ROSI